MELLLIEGVKLDFALWVPRDGIRALKPGLDATVCFKVSDSKSRILRMLNRCWFSLRSAYWMWQTRPDFVIACDPGSLVNAVLLKLLGARRLIYIEYDAPNEWIGLKDRLSAAIRSILPKLADLAIFPSEARYQIFQKQTGAEVEYCLLPNFPRRHELVTEIREFAVSEAYLTLYYHGSFVPARVPRAIFEAMQICPFVKFKIKAVAPIPDNHYQSRVEDWLNELGIKDRVSFLPAVADTEDLKRYAENCQVGVAFYDMSEFADINLASMWGASNKLTQYLGYGLVLLYASSERAVHEAVGSFGVRCDPTDPKDIARCFQLIHQNMSIWNQPRKRALNQLHQEWNFEAGFQVFFQRLKRLV